MTPMEAVDDPPVLSERFEEALVYAARLHRRQRRKGSDIPYVSHLLAVASLVLEAGGDEDQAIAALLHDAVEDQGGLPTLAAIREHFGDAVAETVLACSDAWTEPKPPWRARKEAYLRHLAGQPARVLLVSAADKVHNARAILDDYRRLGDALFDRFTGGQVGTLWYYRQLADTYRAIGMASPLVDELERTVGALEALASEPAADTR
jgi:(p)ppGpp synthase/HD superfamily hydrolase